LEHAVPGEGEFAGIAHDLHVLDDWLLAIPVVHERPELWYTEALKEDFGDDLTLLKDLPLYTSMHITFVSKDVDS